MKQKEEPAAMQPRVLLILKYIFLITPPNFPRTLPDPPFFKGREFWDLLLLDRGEMTEYIDFFCSETCTHNFCSLYKHIE